MRLHLLLLFVSLYSFASAQTNAPLWSDAGQAKHFYLNESLLEAALAGAPEETDWRNGAHAARLSLPSDLGGELTFRFWKSPSMAPGLAAQFPMIQTFAGYSVQNPSIKLRLDRTFQGLHAMIMGPEFTWYIEPVDHEENLYQIIDKADRPAPEFDCETDALVTDDTLDPQSNKGGLLIGNQLRTYRIAIAATGEFTAFHGGTVEDGLSAVVTILHRINGIYERDISARMILIDSNHLIIYTDGDTDPYSGGNGAHLGQNQSNLDDVIGTENYDIGHVFDRGDGGIASLGSVCSSNRKGQGYTATNPPTGDYFAVDYAAHEIGHQFDANHTFNNCGGPGPQPYEPGSATTIMGYAGLCGDNNVANNSDDHFHVISLEEMTQFSILANGNSCATITDSVNTPPLITGMPPANLTIPYNTPFELTGAASDADSDSLTYCWEQFDLGPSSPLGSPQGTAPSFRSRSPQNSPTRVFPMMPVILSNGSSINEVLPAYSRPLSFRLTVRDNAPIGGGVVWGAYDLVATDQAGPFRVTSQNSSTNWQAGDLVEIEWNVAGTDQAPVSADSVNIYLSTPGGLEYPYLLAGPVANNGSTIIQVPDTLNGTGYRVKVKAAENVFFDLNNAPITIAPPTAPGYSALVTNESITVCAPEIASYSLSIAGLLGFEGPILLSAEGLPAELTVGVPDAPVTPPVNMDLQVFGSELVPGGTYPFSLLLQADTLLDTIPLMLEVVAGTPSQIFLSEPADGAMDVSTVPTMSWEGVEGADSYHLEIATDPNFMDIIADYPGVTDTFVQLNAALPDSMQFYWRVTGANLACGLGTPSVIQGFMTENVNCKTYYPDDIPVAFSGLSFIQSRITVEETFPVEDVNVRNIRGSYFPVSELDFRLRTPTGEVVVLLGDNNCFFSGSFNFSIDNDVQAADLDCPFDNGETFHSEESFSDVLGTNSAGTWRLFIYDQGTEGELEYWELELCSTAPLVGTRPEPQEVALEVFPNPSDGLLNVRLAGQRVNGTFALSDLQGREVLRQQINTGEQVDAGQLPAGLYTYRWWSEDGQGISSGKIVLIR